ncbi:ABC transporter ATP-binding protein [Nitriliruptor alkaliphilus]|uniref:ABC transporter ATP-binding protein n=1 Tax=Nitriliruptor alkaliphilus TaxID=427918 RepID=UPI0009F94D75|nr:ABC transporter ATP-binding protein [Nitriliruptor alkaliphilus]
MTDADLHVRDLHVARGGRPVLHGVSLEVPAGEITTLLGPNGAGKSTLVLAVGGVLPATEGSIRMGEVELQGQRPDRVRGAGVAVVPEGRRLLPNLTVRDNLEVATYNLDADEGRTGIERALEVFPELRDRSNARARALSGGQQQMVVLAQALAARPKVVVIDELSLGLAPVVVKRLMPVIEMMAADGTGVLLIEQFAHVALALANRAYVIEGGRIQYSGTAGELRDNPDIVKAAYLLGASGH